MLHNQFHLVWCDSQCSMSLWHRWWWWWCLKMYWLSKTTYFSEIVIRFMGSWKCLLCYFFASFTSSLSLSLSLSWCLPQTTHPFPIDDTQITTSSDYEPLAGEQEVCPEHKSSIISFLFVWLDDPPLMRLGYKRGPIGEKDIWQLDATWDKTEILYSNFQQFWDEEQTRSNPWLLCALNISLGGLVLARWTFQDW